MLSDQSGPTVAGQRPSEAGSYRKRYEQPGVKSSGSDQQSSCEQGQLAGYGQRDANLFNEEQRAKEHDRQDAVQTQNEAQELIPRVEYVRLTRLPRSTPIIEGQHRWFNGLTMLLDTDRQPFAARRPARLSGSKQSSSDSGPAIRLTKRFIASPGASNVLQLAHDERGHS